MFLPLQAGEFTMWSGTTFQFETIIQSHETPVGAGAASGMGWASAAWPVAVCAVCLHDAPACRTLAACQALVLLLSKAACRCHCPAQVRTMTFTHNGNFLVSGDDSGTVRWGVLGLLSS